MPITSAQVPSSNLISQNTTAGLCSSTNYASGRYSYAEGQYTTTSNDIWTTGSNQTIGTGTLSYPIQTSYYPTLTYKDGELKLEIAQMALQIYSADRNIWDTYDIEDIQIKTENKKKIMHFYLSKDITIKEVIETRKKRFVITEKTKTWLKGSVYSDTFSTLIGGGGICINATGTNTVTVGTGWQIPTTWNTGIYGAAGSTYIGQQTLA